MIKLKWNVEATKAWEQTEALLNKALVAFLFLKNKKLQSAEYRRNRHAYG